MNKKNSILLVFFVWFFCIFFSIFCSTLIHAHYMFGFVKSVPSYRAVFGGLHVIFSCVSAVPFFILVQELNSIRKGTFFFQFDVILIGLGAVAFLIAVGQLLNGIQVNLSVYRMIYECFFWCLLAVELISGSVYLNLNNIKRNSLRTFSKIYSGLKKHFLLIILEIISILLIMSRMKYPPKWDNSIYYSMSGNFIGSSMISLVHMMPAGHLGYTFTLLTAACNNIFRNRLATMMILNVVLNILGCTCFYNILRKIIPNKSNVQYALASVIYIFSPYIHGLCHCVNLDYLEVHLLSVVVCCAVYKLWGFHLFFGMLFVFTKENAIFIYFGVCLGIVLVDFFSQKQEFRKKIFILIKNPVYWCMAFIGILWLFLYFLFVSGHFDSYGALITDVFSQEKEVAVQIADSKVSLFFDTVISILNPLKIYLILNFMWIFSIGAVLGTILYIKKRRLLDIYILPLLLGNLFSLLFVLIYRPWNNPRYVSPSVLYPYIFTAYFVLCIQRKIAGTLVLVILDAIAVGSSYRSFDFVSDRIFSKFDMGKVSLYFGITDGSVYNTQYLGHEKGISVALSDVSIGEKIDLTIFFPMVRNHDGVFNTWVFDGFDWNPNEDGYCEYQEYWDTKRLVRCRSPRKKLIPFKVYNVSSSEQIDLFLNDSDGYYVYSYRMGVELAKEIRNNFLILEEKEFVVDGWIYYGILFRKK